MQVSPSHTLPDRWRRTLEVGFWVLVTMVNGVANAITMFIDVRRSDLDVAAWEPAVWELSSGMTWLAIVPGVIWFTRRFPLHWDNWWRQLPWHLLASVIISLAHVLGMVVLRKLAYATQGMAYDFGPLVPELPYEYLKDVRSYAVMVAAIEIYRFIRRRHQGEASLLDRPDEGEPLEPIERPERFLVRKLNREFLVAAADIEWLQAAGNYVNMRVRGHDYPLRLTIAGIEAKPDPARFARTHRSYVPTHDPVASITPLATDHARAPLKDGPVLPCSRRHREGLSARNGAWSGHGPAERRYGKKSDSTGRCRGGP